MTEQWKDFGKSEKGRTIHFATDVSGSGPDDTLGVARCDKNILLLVDTKATITDVTCKKCQQYKDYREAAEEAKSKEPKTDDDPTKKEKTTKAKPKKKPAPKKDEKETTKEPERKDLVPVRTSRKKKEQPKSVKEITKQEEKPIEKEFCLEKHKDTCNIIHTRTGIPFFNNVPEKIADTACKNLNSIGPVWEKKEDQPPKNFLSACRKAVQNAFKEHGLEAPITIKTNKEIKRRKKKEEPKKRTIKRRKKKETKEVKTRVIKRRRKGETKTRVIKRREKPDSIYGMSINKPTGFIASMLKDGTAMIEMIEGLKKQFKLNNKTAKRKVKGVVKKIARKKEIKVVIILGKTEHMDIYKTMSEEL